MVPESQISLIGREEKLSRGKLAAAQYLCLGVLATLILGLWNLQVLGADTYRSQAEANRIRKVPVLAPRGRIFDREGRLLVDNYPSTTCYLLRDQVKDPATDLPLIAQGLHLQLDQLQAMLKRYGSAPRYSRIPLKQDITPDEDAFVEAHRNELPELETLEEQRRLYPRDGFAAHVVGYVGEVSEQMLANDPKYAFVRAGRCGGPFRGGGRPTTPCSAASEWFPQPHRELARQGGRAAWAGAGGARRRILEADASISTCRWRPSSAHGGQESARWWLWTRIQARSSQWCRGPAFDPNEFSGAPYPELIGTSIHQLIRIILC